MIRRVARRQLTRRDGTRYTFADMCGLDHALHDEMFHRGVTPELEDLAGWQFQGWNSSPVAGVIGCRRYIKGFFSEEEMGGEHAFLWGYNVWVRQTGTPRDAWIPSQRWFPIPGERPPERPRRHGIYKVTHAKDSATDHEHPRALLLDYGEGDNPLTHMGRLLRDYMVQVYEDDPTLLMGMVYAAVGRERVRLPGHFMMVRFRRG